MMLVSATNADVPTLHRRFLVWEATAVLRHDLRNKLASVRNAGFYVRRRVEKEAADLLARDARVATMMGLSTSELEAAEAILADRLPRLSDVTTEDVAADRAISLALPHIDARVSTIPSDLTIRGNELELAVAVFCLIENAVDAGADAIEVGAAADGDRVVVTVRDDGRGFDEETARRAPEPFFTTRPGHLGLGLPIVKRIATRAGGELRYDGRFAIAVPRG